MSEKIDARTYWQDVMNKHSASGQTQKEFCEANSISYKQFKYHRYQIIPSVKSKPKNTKPQNQFTEIKIKSEPSHNLIKIRFSNGCKCYLPCDLPAALLSSILKEVGGC
jgi:hypothetical protein